MVTTVFRRHVHFICFLLVSTLVLTLSISLRRLKSTVEISDNAFLEKLRMFDIPAAGVRSTYVFHEHKKYAGIATVNHKQVLPDTTVIILNWSRLDNVILIATLLCGTWLEDLVAQVFIWNNNANTSLSYLDFNATGCHPHKLRIYNSPSNTLFKARYIACAQASTEFCFTQDDDFLVQPQIIRNMHQLFKEDPSQMDSLHLLSTHDHLLSRLRTVSIVNSSIETTFAWLGYGTYLKKVAAERFLELVQLLKLSDEELAMADNYFTILRNRLKYSEIMFDHGIELGGGQPFTVGLEGDNRNEIHMTRALQYLSDSSDILIEKSDYSRDARNSDLNLAPCRAATCVLQSNIELIKLESPTVLDSARSFTPTIRRKYEEIDEKDKEHYLRNPLSNMVDGRIESVFVSPKAARKGEWLMLDALQVLSESPERRLEFVILISDNMTDLLPHCECNTSLDLTVWESTPANITCTPVSIGDVGGPLYDKTHECSYIIPRAARYVRLSIREIGNIEQEELPHWAIRETWLRYAFL